MKGIRVKTDGTFTKALIQDPETGESILCENVNVIMKSDGSFSAWIEIPIRGIDTVQREILPVADEDIYKSTMPLDTIYGADEVPKRSDPSQHEKLKA